MAGSSSHWLCPPGSAGPRPDVRMSGRSFTDAPHGAGELGDQEVPMAITGLRERMVPYASSDVVRRRGVPCGADRRGSPPWIDRHTPISVLRASAVWAASRDPCAYS